MGGRIGRAAESGGRQIKAAQSVRRNYIQICTNSGELHSAKYRGRNAIWARETFPLRSAGFKLAAEATATARTATATATTLLSRHASKLNFPFGRTSENYNYSRTSSLPGKVSSYQSKRSTANFLIQFSVMMIFHADIGLHYTVSALHLIDEVPLT